MKHKGAVKIEVEKLIIKLIEKISLWEELII